MYNTKQLKITLMMFICFSKLQSPLTNLRVKTSGFLSKPQFFAQVLVFINNLLTNLTPDLGVHIKDVNINIKLNFVSLFTICFNGWVNDHTDYDDKFIPLVFF